MKRLYEELLGSMLDKPSWEVREPKPGLRHDTKDRLVAHRFPIKSGLTRGEVIVRQVSQGNALLTVLEKRRAK